LVLWQAEFRIRNSEFRIRDSAFEILLADCGWKRGDPDMGEIKSTLDLVMEKTRDMKMSPEELLEQKRRDLEQRIHGLLQKAQDRLLETNAFRAEYEELNKEQGVSDDAAFIKAALDRINLETDNAVLLALLKNIAQVDASRLSTVCDEFRSALLDASQNATETLKSELERTHHLSGSAVIPNLEKNPRWRTERQRLTTQFEQRLQQEKARLVGSS
jgi:hypothetical protein